MTDSRFCGKCGVPLGSDTLAGLCPACLLQSACGSAPETTTPPIGEETTEILALPVSPILSRFGDYELLEELAHGGMGVVYKARQPKLDRVVALKMLLLGQRASDEVVERFKREAQAAARLRHRHVVAIYEVGEIQGQPFFSMEYVQGKDLAKIVRERPLPARQAATYLRAVAQAIHYAHQQGIIHRDLKPSNILVDFASDEVRVTDFGLAKRLDDHSDLTLSGQVMGSPNHMAPELAAGHHRLASPASDVFSLGAILYELLTGRPPFLADSIQATLLKIRDAEPVAPRLLNASIPRDLETIGLKCLEKEPGARFASAQDLADELGRYLAGEPIRTRPAGVIEKTWRWCRRKPALAGLAVAMAALAVVSSTAAIRLELASQRQEREQYYAHIGLAKEHIEEGNIERALALLMNCPRRYRHWEWGHLLYLCHQEVRTIPAHTNVLSMVDIRDKLWVNSMSTIEFSPDSQSLVTLGTDGTAKIWSVDDGRALFRFGSPSNRIATLAFSSEGNRLASVEGGRVQLRDARTGAPQLEVSALAATATHLAWRPDGQRLAVGMSDGTVEILDPADGSHVRVIGGATPSPVRLFYTPDGLGLVRQDATRCVRFDPESGREETVFPIERQQMQDVVSDPYLRRCVVRDRESRITLWENGHPAQALGEIVPQGEPSVVFSPSGRRFASQGLAGFAKVWDTDTRQPLFVIPDRVYARAFSPDGKRLATAGSTTVAHVWDIDTGREVRALRGHQELVELVAFSPNGQLVATGARDGVVKLWSGTDGREVIWHPSIPWAVALSPDGKHFTAGPVHEGVTVRESRSGRGLVRLRVEGDYMTAACFSPDGRRLLTSSRFHQPRVWEVESGRLLFTLEGHTRAVSWGVAFSPDGRRIVTSGSDGTARLWDAERGHPLRILAGGRSDYVDSAAFSPDSRLLVTIRPGDEGEAIVWEVESGNCRQQIRAHEGACVAVGFSPDASRIVTSGLDNSIRFWDVHSGALKKELRLRGYAIVMRFSPDGARLFCWTTKLAWMRRDIPTLEIWDVEAGRQVVTLRGHSDMGAQLSLSANGKQVLSGACDGTVRQWQLFPWAESDYPGSAQEEFLSRVRRYADEYWQRRLTDEAAAIADPTTMRVIQVPFDRSLIPSQDPRASSRLIDLTRHYTSPLNRPALPSFGLDTDNDLRNLPPGTAEYEGARFDVRGVIQLRPFPSGGPIFELPWRDVPVRVDGLPIRQRVQRLHILQGAWDRELDGTPIANLVWHFADGQQRESEIIYGRHVRSWWVGHDANRETTEARIAWEGTNPPATDFRSDFPVGEPGKELRLYAASWENPRPEVEVTSLDLVSRQTQSAPFVLGITVE